LCTGEHGGVIGANGSNARHHGVCATERRRQSREVWTRSLGV